MSNSAEEALKSLTECILHFELLVGRDIISEANQLMFLPKHDYGHIFCILRVQSLTS